MQTNPPPEVSATAPDALFYRPPPLDEDLSKKIFDEARRKNARPSKVFWYWLRLGIQAEPKIKSILP